MASRRGFRIAVLRHWSKIWKLLRMSTIQYVEIRTSGSHRHSMDYLQILRFVQGQLESMRLPSPSSRPHNWLGRTWHAVAGARIQIVEWKRPRLLLDRARCM